MISKKDTRRLRSLLLKDRRRIGKVLKKLGHVEFGNDIDSGEEEADEAEEMVSNAATKWVLQNRLKDIDGALKKFEQNKYGICEKCKKDISIKLLEIDPESSLCQHCKKEHEENAR
jgi:DnaK suppressor protein